MLPGLGINATYREQIVVAGNGKLLSKNAITFPTEAQKDAEEWAVPSCM